MAYNFTVQLLTFNFLTFAVVYIYNNIKYKTINGICNINIIYY